MNVLETGKIYRIKYGYSENTKYSFIGILETKDNGYVFKLVKIEIDKNNVLINTNGRISYSSNFEKDVFHKKEYIGDQKNYPEYFI